jgi:hypothetical protein
MNLTEILNQRQIATGSRRGRMSQFAISSSGTKRVQKTRLTQYALIAIFMHKGGRL